MANSDALTKHLSDRRIKVAQNRVGIAQNIALFNQQREYERQQREYEEQQEAIRIEQEREQRKQESAGFFEKLGVTLADVFTELGGGLFKLGEGIVDAALTIVGGTFYMPEVIKFNAADEWYYSWEDELTKNSYLYDNIGQDIFRGVGQALPMIAGAVLSAIPVTAPVGVPLMYASFAGNVASAGGQGAEEALNDGASGLQALGYGVAMSGIEFGMEYATMGLGKGVGGVMKTLGKAAQEGGEAAIKAASKSALKQVGKTMIEEAIEEGLTDLVNPLAKTIYKGAEAFEEYKSPDFWKKVGTSALVGGIVGGVAGGVGKIALVNVAGGKANYNVQQSVQEVKTLDTKVDNLWKNDKLTSEQTSKIDAARQAEMDNIGKQLKAMDGVKRSEAIKKYGLSQYFNEQGEILQSNNAQNGASTAQVGVDGQTSRPNPNEARKPLISDNTEAYSPSLRNTELKLAPTSNALSEASINAKQVIGSLSPNTRIVVTDAQDYNGNVFNAFYDGDNRVVYVNNNANATDVMRSVAVHEITHTLEGTKQYAKLAEYVEKNIPDFAERVEKAKSLYEGANSDLKQGETGKRLADYEARTEVIADWLGENLSNEQSVQNIVNKNKPIAARIYQWLKSAVDKLSGKGQAKGEKYAFLRKAERLYASAIKKSIGGMSLSNVRMIYEVEDEIIKEYLKQAEQESAASESGQLKPAVQYSLDKLSEKEIYNLRNSERVQVAENEAQIRKFIDDAISGNVKGKKLILGKINLELAQKIKSETGIDVQGYNLELRANDVYHIIKEHGAEAAELPRGQRAVTANDIYNFADIVTNYENVKVGEDNSLLFTKTIDGKATAVTLYAIGNKSLSLKTMYINKKGRTIPSGNANSQVNNAQGERGINPSDNANRQADRGTTSTNSISENSDNVKGSGECPNYVQRIRRCDIMKA